MPRRKPKPEKVIEEKIRENLDAIIMEESLDTIVPNTEELPRMKTTDLMNFKDEKISALSEAQALLDSIAKFYVDPNVYGSADHVELKKRMDATNLSAMMFQLKSAQHAITKLLEEIDLGNMHPRIFEVLAQLQSQIMQMPKDYQAYIEKMEQNYKKAKLEIEDKKSSGGVIMDTTDSSDGSYQPAFVQQGSGIKTRGTKGLMEGLRDILGTEIVDIKPVEVDPNAIVNAREKKIIDSQMGISSEGDDDMEGVYTIEDDILD
jgi:hypothetical protein